MGGLKGENVVDPWRYIDGVPPVLRRRAFVVGSLVVLSLLSCATGGHAQQGKRAQARGCAENLQRFVESIDELLAKNVLENEPFWAVIREYLPAKGCTVEEVISISRTSKFYAPPFEQYAVYTISFRNSDTVVSFGLQKDTGNIEYPGIGTTHLPSW
jgi:hypothetical protein